MAGTASPDDLAVVDSHHRCENVRGVTILAHVSRLDMRRILAGRLRAVVAAHAVASDIDVIEVRRQPANAAVAVVAGVAAGDMGRILAGSLGTVVATEAIARNIHMVKIGR